MKTKRTKRSGKSQRQAEALQPARELLEELYLAIGRAALTIEQARSGIGVDAAANLVHADLVKNAVKAAKKAEKTFRQSLEEAGVSGK
jgi:hypothetical protein